MRLTLIFIITFLMVMNAHGQERHGWGGGGHDWHGGGAPRYYGHGWGGHNYGNDFATGMAGAAVGGMLGRWLFPPEPPVVVVQQPQEPVRTVGWCLDRYKSYDPSTRSYLGYDGYRHSCP